MYYTCICAVDSGVNPGAAATDTSVFTINQPFEVLGITAVTTTDAGNECDLDSSDIRTNLQTTTAIFEPNPAAFGAVGGTATIITNVSEGTTTSIFGTITLTVELANQAGCAATDAVTVNAIIRTIGDVASPITGVTGSGRLVSFLFKQIFPIQMFNK